MTWINVALLALTMAVALAEPEDGRRVIVMFIGLATVVLLVLVIAPAADWAIRGPVILRRRRRRRLRAAHVCLQCGYSLTGNVSGVCPECGTPCTEATS